MRINNVHQGTNEWRELRAGVITGTTLKRALSSTSRDFMFELIAEKLAPVKESISNDAMDRGIRLESAALGEYETRTQTVVLDDVGFCLHEKYDWLGLSPDGLVRKKGKHIRGLEIKCPDSKNHIKYMVNDRIPSEYKYQVMQYFIVCEELEALDFVTYDPRIAIPELRLKVITVTREELKDDIKVVMDKLFKFREKWVATERELTI